MSYPSWTPDPVKDAEEYAEYIEDNGVEMEESDHHKTLFDCFKIMNEYHRQMRKKENDTRINKDSERTESTEKQEK